MSVYRSTQLPDFRPILNWAGVVGIVWLLLLWKCVEFSAQDYYAYAKSPPANALDAHVQIYAAGEQQFSPRRSFHSLSSLPPADQPIPDIVALFYTVLAMFVLPLVQLTFKPFISTAAHQLQWATLNISRAPPYLPH